MACDRLLSSSTPVDIRLALKSVSVGLHGRSTRLDGRDVAARAGVGRPTLRGSQQALAARLEVI